MAQVLSMESTAFSVFKNKSGSPINRRVGDSIPGSSCPRVKVSLSKTLYPNVWARVGVKG